MTSINTHSSPVHKSKVGAAFAALSKRFGDILRVNAKNGHEEPDGRPSKEFLYAFATQTRALQTPNKYAETLVEKHRFTKTPFWVAIEKELEITRENSTYALEVLRPFRNALPEAYHRLENTADWEAWLIACLIDLRNDRRIRSVTQARIYCRSASADHQSQGLYYLTADQNNNRSPQSVVNG